mgnify:CR=1 FL=1
MKHIDKISDYLKDEADTIDRINKMHGEPCPNNSVEARQKFEELKKELEMATNKENVRQFVGLLLNGDTVENAAKISGVGSMKLHDLCVAISGMDYANTLESLVSHAKEAIQAVKDLDNALTDLKKSSEK